jgi:hypothetical protein
VSSRSPCVLRRQWLDWHTCQRGESDRRQSYATRAICHSYHLVGIILPFLGYLTWSSETAIASKALAVRMMLGQKRPAPRVLAKGGPGCRKSPEAVPTGGGPPACCSVLNRSTAIISRERSHRTDRVLPVGDLQDPVVVRKVREREDEYNQPRRWKETPAERLAQRRIVPAARVLRFA